MSKLILQNIADNISFDSLPARWQNFDLKSFSREKTLYDFQQKALENALKILWKYYESEIDYQENEKLEVNQKRKEEFFKFYTADPNFPEKGVEYDLTKKEGKKTAKLIEEYYPVKDGKVGFENFINRMGFWMATGSGKTLVIVKLIEILKKLIENKEIPANDILFLTHRDDLIDQFKEYIREFNASNSDIFINLKSLKEYESVKRETQSLFRDKEITIFYYRSDLISDEEKEKIINFRNYDNDGRWYILLDEAHKGDKEDSKRQVIYSILSRNGFLFNFSATFTDPRDFITTGFNFNLKEFIEAGYGKRVYLSQEEIKAFKEKEDFSAIEKQKIVLKALILLSYIRKFAEKIKKTQKRFYHYPLLLTLVNTVNPKEMEKEPDLVLFFKEIEKIGQGKINEKLFESAKKELVEKFEIDKRILIPEGEEFIVDEKLLKQITFQDVLKDVFNSKSPGNIEVLTIPENRQEMVFKLRTSEKPFALIKIGNISGWLKDQLDGYEINESFDNESVFKKINRDDSDINILMGSRSFYEGWDSNRPNIILFINIGVGKDAKKFVLQSVGRGIRIEPIKNKRKRLWHLFTAKKIKENVYRKIKNYIFPIETLFIFGTNAGALKEVIKTFEDVKGKEYSLAGQFKLNKKAEKLPLFVPVYKPASYILADAKEPKSYVLEKDDFNLAKKYFEYFEDERVFLARYETEPKIVKTIKKSFKEPLNYYKFEGETAVLNPDIILSRIIDHFSLIPEKFDRFEKVEKGKFIVHFEKARFSKLERLDEFLEKMEEVKSIEKKEEKIKSLQLELFEEGIKDKDLFSQPFNGIKIKYVPNHYYYPIILSESKHKIGYLNHIITEESEIKFIKELDNYLMRKDNLFNKKFNWWLFSKLDETTDDVYIPWYNPKSNKIERFKPDFIFWLKEKRSKNYYIVFIDPKGTEHT
ncbi:DEAD/DEAH box helicase family protein, partial [bacterium]|nr:DEAD/DEAH box helicase family protein [bacterium]